VTATLSHLVGQYGLLAIFLTMAGESCGLPLPSEVVVPTGGALAALGHLNLIAVVLVASAANLTGSVVAYWIAAQWGERFLLGPGRWIGIRRHHVRIADRWFQRHGLLAVFVGRLLPVIRTYISFPAGMARVPFGRFLLLSFAGAVPWNLALAWIGYTLGTHFDTVARFIQNGGYLVAVLALVVVVLWWWRGRSDEEGEAAAA
jgi:membrane protein DedA with SNARE-associated domain